MNVMVYYHLLGMALVYYKGTTYKGTTYEIPQQTYMGPIHTDVILDWRIP